MIPTNKDFADLLGYHMHLRCTLPKTTAATEKLYFYGTVRGRAQGAGFVFPPDIIGKTLWKKDSESTTTTKVEKTFLASEFLNPEKPLLSEIVTALNTGTVALGTGWDEATDTDASSGAQGELVVGGAGTGTTNTLEIGGTACPYLGFPSVDGITVQIDNADYVNITFPTFFAGKEYAQWMYTRNPRVHVGAVTVATDVVASLAITTGYVYTWTPSTRVLEIGDGSGDAARVADIQIWI